MKDNDYIIVAGYFNSDVGKYSIDFIVCMVVSSLALETKKE